MLQRLLGLAWDHSGEPLTRIVHSSSRWFTQALISIVGFIRVGVGSRGYTWGSSGSFGFAWVHSDSPWGSQFIRVRVGSFGCGKWSSGSLGFAWAHSCVPRGHCVH